MFFLQALLYLHEQYKNYMLTDQPNTIFATVLLEMYTGRL